MELRLDEQKLLAEFRRLTPEGKNELIEFAEFLVKKYQDAAEENPTAENQCPVPKHGEERPEAVKEPIFTE
jgi:hypothetical protein